MASAYTGSGDAGVVYRIRHERNNDNSLKSDHVNVMFQDSEGDYWYGTNNGVSSINLGHANGPTIWTVRNIVAKWYWRLPKTDRGTSVGGYGIGVYCIHKQTGRVQKKEKRN